MARRRGVLAAARQFEKPREGVPGARESWTTRRHYEGVEVDCRDGLATEFSAHWNADTDAPDCWPGAAAHRRRSGRLARRDSDLRGRCQALMAGGSAPRGRGAGDDRGDAVFAWAVRAVTPQPRVEETRVAGAPAT